MWNIKIFIRKKVAIAVISSSINMASLDSKDDFRSVYHDEYKHRELNYSPAKWG